MSTIDPVSAALDAVAARLGSLESVAAARRGWPEHPQDLDLSGGPVCTLVPIGQPERAPCAAHRLAHVDLGDGTIRTTYRVGWLTIEAQLDLWAAYRAARDDVALAIEDALNPRVPWRVGLSLSSTNYFGRPLEITASGGTSVDTAAAVAEGEWRYRWQLTIQTDVVRRVTHPAQQHVILADLNGDTDLVIP